MSIKKMLANLRPRERALSLGVENLKDNELLSIFIRNGTKKYDALNIANILLSKYNSLAVLSKINVHELLKLPGIGQVKALEIHALFELVKRINFKLQNLKIFNSINIVINFAHEIIGHKHNEHLLIILLNADNKLINHQIVYIGTETTLNFDPKDIIKLCLKYDAFKFYCIHNHPSGIVKPSFHDIFSTKRLNHYAQIFNIHFVSHIIINSEKKYFIIQNHK